MQPENQQLLEFLERLSSGYPLLCAEHTLISCKIKEGNVIPMEGVNQLELERVMKGDVVQKYAKSSKLLEKFQISYFLSMLQKHEATEEEYELESYPKTNMENRLCHRAGCPTMSRSQETKNENNRRNHSPGSYDSDFVQKDNRNGQKTSKSGSYEDGDKLTRIRNYSQWLNTEDGKEFVFTESFSSLKEAVTVLGYLKRMKKPFIVTLLARENEPVIMTFSSIHISLECVLFCLFQA